MNLVDIFTLWKAGDDIPDSKDALGPEQIESYLRPRIRKNTIPLYINVVMYLCMHLASIGLLSINLGIFRNNGAWFAATTGMLLTSVAGFLYGIWIFRNLSYRNTDLKLIEYIKTRISFFRRQYEVWLWFCSASVIILPIAINTNTDSIDGTYAINNVRLFITIFSVIWSFSKGPL